VTYHTLSASETLQQLSVSPAGLGSEEVQRRRERYGANILPSGPEYGIVYYFLQQFKSPVIYILLIAALISMAIGEYTDALFILGVLVLNAIIGTYQEYSSSQKAKHLQNLISTHATVMRDGKALEIESSLIVPGDIVIVEPGTKVSADIRLLHSRNLQVDESLLTGESLDTAKDAEFVTDDPFLMTAGRKNMLFGGTFVSSGRGMGIAVATGAYTEAGKIAALISQESRGRIPLLEKMEKLSYTISLFMGVTIALLFAIGVARGIDLYSLFFFSVALAVAAIPEGLPVAITVALTSASLAMSKRNVIIRKLAAIEGLGACTLIASDKTGTLTRNRLSVEYFISPTRVYDTEVMGEAHEMVYLASILCNEMHYEEAKEGKREFYGDQVDIALARFAARADDSYITASRSYRKIDEIPYEPVNKFSAVMMELESGIFEFSKGSPEIVLSHCDISAPERDEILLSVDEWAMKGYRTIALAFKESHNSATISLSGFTYLGFVAIIDPVRPEAPASVRTAQEAGIRVVMVTGDHPNTALCIAQQLGIASTADEVMHEHSLRRWEEEGADPEVIREKSVFSRVTPSQKMKIVEAYGALGHYVAVTGDGVNDAPALRHANIGVAMGKGGTDIAKASSDIILTDDNFSSIVGGIEEGRRAHDNIRKVIYLLISTGFAELVMVMLSFIAGMPLPLLPVQLLWLNLVSNGIQDVLLGLEKAEPGLLRRPPRPPGEPIFNPLMLRRIAVGGFYIAIVSFVLFYILIESGMDEFSARNIVLLLMVLFENVHIFNARSELNFLHRIGYRESRVLIWWVIFIQLFHLACMHIPLAQQLLHIEPVSLEMWSLLLGLALGLVAVMEGEKWLRLRKKTDQGAI